MLRILRYAGGRFFFFKRILIGIKLVSNSFKILIFQHNQYFIFCFIIACAQLFRIYLIGLIDPRISTSMTVTDALEGQNLFINVINYRNLSLSFFSAGLIFMKTFFIYIQLIIIFLTNLALSYYTFARIEKHTLSTLQSFYKSLKKFRVVAVWAFLNIILLLVTASLGTIGTIVQFAWELSTILSLQIIAFEKINALGVLKHSLNYFKRMFANIVGIDLVVDGFILLLNIIFIVFRAKLPAISFFSETGSLSFVVLAIILYMVAIVLASEAITLTILYKRFYRHEGAKNK